MDKSVDESVEVVEIEDNEPNLDVDYEARNESYYIKSKKDVVEEKEEIVTPIKPVVFQNRKIDVSFLSDDVEEEVDEIETKTSPFDLSDKEEDYDDYDTEVSKKDFNKFLEEDDDIGVDLEDSESEDGVESDYEEDDYNDDYNDFIDNTGRVLSRELEDEDDRLLRDTDPIERNMFEETANYFLTGKSEVYGKDDLRNLYKSKQKIIDSDDVSSTDDAVAKMVLAMTDGLLNLPRVTGRLFKKAKNSGRKMRENMIVEDEEDDG